MSHKTEIPFLHFLVADLCAVIGVDNLSDGHRHLAVAWFILAVMFSLLLFCECSVAFKAWRERRRERRRAWRTVAASLRCVEEWKAKQ